MTPYPAEKSYGAPKPAAGAKSSLQTVFRWRGSHVPPLPLALSRRLRHAPSSPCNVNYAVVKIHHAYVASRQNRPGANPNTRPNLDRVPNFGSTLSARYLGNCHRQNVPAAIAISLFAVPNLKRETANPQRPTPTEKTKFHAGKTRTRDAFTLTRAKKGWKTRVRYPNKRSNNVAVSQPMQCINAHFTIHQMIKKRSLPFAIPA